MLRTQKNNHPLSASLMLGVLTFLYCTMQHGRAANFAMPVAAFPLFVAAIAFGFRGGLYAVLIGIVPVIFIGGDMSGGLRLAALVSVVGAIRSAEPRLPSYLVTLLTWVLLVMPLRTFFYPPGVYPIGAMATRFWEHHLLLGAMSDVLTTLVAGAFLLNPSFWTFVTKRPYRTNVYFLMTHVLTLTSLLSVLAVIATFNRLGIFTQNRFLDTNLWTAFGLLTTFVFIPSLIAFRLSLLATRGYAEEFQIESVRLLQGADHEENWEDGLPEELYQSVRAPLQALGVDANRLGVCAVDENGMVIFINDQFRAAANIILPGNVGRPIEALATESPLVDAIKDLLVSTPSEREIVAECKLPRSNGSNQFFEVTLRGRSEQDAQSRAPRVITVRDITERRTVERHLLDSQRRQSLATFISTSARNITDHCTTIAGKTSCASLSSDPATWKEALVHATHTAQQAGRLASQLQEYASDSSQSGVIPLDLRELLRDNENLLESTAGSHCTLQFDGNSPEVFSRVDQQLVLQALTNIIRNARDSYENRPGTIRISVLREEIDQLVAYLHPGTKPGSFVRIRVSDNGIGMPPEILSRATEPLFSTRSESGNTGLGLSTVFAIMREHDGFMTIESKPKSGTTVSLYFPVTAKPEQHTTVIESDTPAHTPITLGSGSVVVVENRDDLREVLCDMVSTLGYQVTSCRDASEASQLVKSRGAQIVVLDEEIRFNRDDALIKQLKDDNLEIKTVLLVSSVHGVPAGLDGVLQKPFDLSRLAHALKAVACQKRHASAPSQEADRI